MRLKFYCDNGFWVGLPLQHACKSLELELAHCCFAYNSYGSGLLSFFFP